MYYISRTLLINPPLMYNEFEQLLAVIENDSNELRELLYDIANKDLQPSIDTLLNCQNNMLKCGLCMKSCELKNLIYINSRILKFLNLVSDNRFVRTF